MKSTSLMLSIAALLVLGISTPAAGQEVVVIINADNGATDLTATQVRRYFLKTSPTWNDGEKVRPVDRVGASEERETFLNQILSLSPSEFERYWIERQYANAQSRPIRVSDDSEVLRMVESFKGAIGFVSATAYDAADHSRVRAVLRIGS